MKIEIVKNIDDLKNLKCDWERLFELVNCTTFQSFDFNYFSWVSDLRNNKKNQLAIAVVKKQSETVAIFPFYVDAKRQLRFINDIHADFCDCISSREIDVQQLFSHIKDIFSVRKIRLINIKANARINTYFKTVKIANSLCSSFEKYTLLDLVKGNFPDNYSKFKSKQKTEFRRIQKKNKDKAHLILSVEESNFPIQDIIMLKEKMLTLGFRKKHFLPNKQLTLIEHLYNQKHILLSVVKKDKRIYALSFVLQKEKEYLFWIDMFDDSKMINLFNYISFMQKLSTENTICMNLGRGIYNYKIANFNPKIEQLYAIHIFDNKTQLYLSQLSERVLRIAKRIYKKMIR